MLLALMWGGLAGSALFIGALLGLYVKIKKHIVSFIMAFGTGVLMGAATFEMLFESAEHGGIIATSTGFLIGAIVFTIFNVWLAIKGANERKRSSQNPEGHSGLAIFVGTIIDSLPEAVIIGISMIYTDVSLVLVIAIFISNLPEGLSSTIGLKQDHYTNKKILFLWFIVCSLSAICSLLGYVVLEGASDKTIAYINTFAAGGIVAMVSSTMMPEAYEDGGPIVGFITALGLLTSLILTVI